MRYGTPDALAIVVAVIAGLVIRPRGGADVTDFDRVLLVAIVIGVLALVVKAY